MRLALYQPDIAPNVGTLLRLGACFGIAVDVIEPCGFPFSDRAFRRAALDYLRHAEIVRHTSWEVFLDQRAQTGKGSGRLVLLTTCGATPYDRFAFRSDDTILLGRETAGVPDAVHAAADARLVIPMRAGLRSLNVAVAGGIVLAEALRQTGLFPASPPKEEP